MSWLRWLPWRFILSRAARSHGFMDPIALLARLQNLSQPSEVGEPIELLRAGVVFHARGLINKGVIQHNLDWIWPYWITRQFDPGDESFIPRGFSITHVNLTHRNWTAIGYPDCPELPVVDPRGLLTPIYDGWSLDGWLLTDDGRCLLPSQTADCRQSLDMHQGITVTTETSHDDLSLSSDAWVEYQSTAPVCRMRLNASADANAWLALALRPCNPEGISFVHDVRLSADRTTWTIGNEQTVSFSVPAARHQVSDYRHGDVYIYLRGQEDHQAGHCEHGLITAAALFPVAPGEHTEVIASIPLTGTERAPLVADAWGTAVRQGCRLNCPEPRYQFLYDAALRSLVLHSPGDVYPGPYTYKRFWFRDAAFIIHALLCAGFKDRALRALRCFPDRQTTLGYFRSQEGEWDANGEVLWILERFQAMTGEPLGGEWRRPIERGARWIMRKRLADKPDSPHAGLLPPGFSAEHLGPNDYYYWDDFWCVAGLHAAGKLFQDFDTGAAADFTRAAGAFEKAVDRSLAACVRRLGRPAMPASPYRRLDSGAIGSLAIGYPLQICEPRDPRLLDSVEFLLDRCFVDGAFFQDMIHSGLNVYLTLHVAQILLRAGDRRYLELMDAVVGLASPTGQWPEAIHPRTRGGCMGDGQHVWAAAEWVIMIRNCFVREEGGQLILCGGIPERWLNQNQKISFGPAPTSFGAVTITIAPNAGNGPRVAWHGEWHRVAPQIEVRLPGYEPVYADTDANSVTPEKRPEVR